MACSCGDKPSILEGWYHANQVFIGKVIEANYTKVAYSYNGFIYISFTIEIEEMIKGELIKKYRYYTFDEAGNEFEVYDSTSYYLNRTFFYQEGGSCDFKFQKGKRYLIYAYEMNFSFLRVSKCSRTAEVTEELIPEIEMLRLLKNGQLKDKIPFHSMFNKHYDNTEVDLVIEQLNAEKFENRILKYIIIPFLSVLLLGSLFMVFRYRKKNKHSIKTLIE
jgi:hypothetical protein